MNILKSLELTPKPDSTGGETKKKSWINWIYSEKYEAIVKKDKECPSNPTTNTTN
jgi:hypothetical protein